MCFEIAEKGRDDAHLMDFAGGRFGSFAAAGSLMVFAFPVGIFTGTLAGYAHILFCSSSLALVDSTSHDVVARSTLDLAPTRHAIATEDTQSGLLTLCLELHHCTVVLR